MVSGSALYRVTVSIDAGATGALAGDLQGLRGRHRLAGRAAAGPAVAGRDGAHLPAGDRAVSRAAEIRFACSCPDYASMCKHVAAVLYGVGARLDHQPELLFRLRAVDEKDLLAGIDRALPMTKAGAAAGKGAGSRRPVGDVRSRYGGQQAGRRHPRKVQAGFTQTADGGGLIRPGEALPADCPGPMALQFLSSGARYITGQSGRYE